MNSGDESPGKMMEFTFNGAQEIVAPPPAPKRVPSAKRKCVQLTRTEREMEIYSRIAETEDLSSPDFKVRFGCLRVEKNDKDEEIRCDIC